MALDFPVNPTTGQTYFNWKWDGAKWVRMSETATGVDSFNGRTGAVTLGSSDVSAAGGALINDPDFTGSPTCPTPSPGDNSTNLATTAFVSSAIAAAPSTGVSSFNTRTGAVTLLTSDLTGAGGAPLASPVFTGNPTAPTPAAGDNDTSVATTAFVATSFAPLNSPIFTGAPTAPTVAVGDNSTKIATTAWVQSRPIAIGDNRIINGDMRIDQRNGGASGSANGYTIDRWQYSGTQSAKGAWQQVTTMLAPGFPYALAFTSSSAYAVVAADAFVFLQVIEADMISDFAWGTANAQPVTLSFWARSTLTGTFGGSIRNAANTRSYPFTFSIPTAGTPTKISITIPGDTAGTWVMNGNNAALSVIFSLGAGSTGSGPANAWASANYVSASGAVSVVGTNGAVFWVTGVKLEIGNVVTPFNRQSLTKSLADCQRYYQTFNGYVLTVLANGSWSGSLMNVYFQTTMRATPTVTPATSPASGFVGTMGLALANTQWAVLSAGSVQTNVSAYATVTGTLSAEL
jgi:hypothetical protein